MERHNEIRHEMKFQDMFTPIVFQALKDLGFVPHQDILMVRTDPLMQTLTVRRTSQKRDERRTFILIIPGERLNADFGRGYLEIKEDYIVLDLPLHWIFSEFFMKMMKDVGYIPGDFCIFKTNYENSEVIIGLCKTIRKSGQNWLEIAIPEREE